MEVLKEYEISNKHEEAVSHKMVFFNQLVYRLAGLTDNKSKRILINNFFKTKHFQEMDYSKYEVKDYDYHQFCFLLKLSPEAFLYTAYVFNKIESFNKEKIKPFLKARYYEALHKALHDEQLYYYFALKCYGFNDIIQETAALVLETQNQVIVSYYLKEGFFTQEQKNILKMLTDEQYWFQNYHLILHSPELSSDLEMNIEKYLIPKQAVSKEAKKERYKNFYKENLENGKDLIREMDTVVENIKGYLDLRHEETAVDF